MYKRLDTETPVIQKSGIFRKQISLFEAVALIVSGTIGAGILGIPYAIAQVGAAVGMAYIVVLGFLMMGLNLMVGEIAARTKGEFQMVGLARKYLGRWGEWFMTLVLYAMLFGVLMIYIIGEGEALAALFGGSSFQWSIIFFIVGGACILVGMRTIKVVDFFLSIGILAVILIIAWFSAPFIDSTNFIYHDLARVLFPYGVILFAYHGVTTVPEAHSLLKNRDTDFKRAIIIAGFITIASYALFGLFVVGATGIATTEIATIGLGDRIGPAMFIFGNIFAVFAMGTSFLVNGLSLKDSLAWDYRVPRLLSGIVVLAVPFTLFVLGIRGFIAAIDIVGGVFISFEMLIVLLIYWRAKHLGELKKSKYRLHHTLWLLMALVAALSIGAVYSVAKLF